MNPRIAGWLVVLAGVVGLAAIVWIKGLVLKAWLGNEFGYGVLALASLALLVVGVARSTRAPRASAMVAVPLMVILFVDLMVTPLPYEIAREAAALPHPAGEVGAPIVETSLLFERGHPQAFVVFRYPNAVGLGALVNETLDAYRAQGWTVDGVSNATGEGPNDFAVLNFEKAPFTADCVLGTRDDLADMPHVAVKALGCHLAV